MGQGRALHAVAIVAAIGALVAAALLSDRWVRLVAVVAGHQRAAEAAICVLLGVVGVGLLLAGASATGRRAAAVASAGSGLVVWLIVTQPYGRLGTDEHLLHQYRLLAPGYLTGLDVLIGLSLVALGLAVVMWRLRGPGWLFGHGHTNPPFRRALLGFDRVAVDEYFRRVAAGATDDMQTVTFPTRWFGYSEGAVTAALDRWTERRGLPFPSSS